MDLWQQFLLVRASKFAPIDGEDREVVNPGMYGRAVAEYVRERLPAHGLEVSRYDAEDRGWRAEICGGSRIVGLCIYRGLDDTGSNAHAVCLERRTARAWSWSRFRLIDDAEELNTVMKHLIEIFNSDPEVEFLGAHVAFPLGEEQ